MTGVPGEFVDVVSELHPPRRLRRVGLVVPWLRSNLDLGLGIKCCDHLPIARPRGVERREQIHERLCPGRRKLPMNSATPSAVSGSVAGVSRGSACCMTHVACLMRPAMLRADRQGRDRACSSVSPYAELRMLWSISSI